MAAPDYLEAYSGAVFGAAVPFGLFPTVLIVFGNIEWGTSDSIGTTLLYLATMSSILFLVAVVLIAILAWIPILLACAVAARWKLNAASYFVGAGIAAGASLAPVFLILTSPFRDPEDVSLMSAYIHALPLFMLSGGLGGLCFWFERRHWSTKMARDGAAH